MRSIRLLFDVEDKLLLLFHFYGLVKISPQTRHTNFQRHQILLVLLFVWSGKKTIRVIDITKGVCRFMSACYYVTRRSTWELSVRPFLFSNKVEPTMEGNTNSLDSWNSGIQTSICLSAIINQFYRVTTIYYNRSKSSTSISVIAILIYLIGTLRFNIIFPTLVEDVE